MTTAMAKKSKHPPADTARLRVEYVPIEGLKPWKDNPQIHDAAQVAEIDASIKGFGFVEPILVRRADREVIHGHGRLDALIASGATEAPVIFIDLPKRRAHALALALNKLAEKSPWDPAKLSMIFADLKDLAADVVLTGFSPEEISGYTTDEKKPIVEGKIPDDQYQILVDCKEEERQQKLFERLKRQGYQCRLLTL